MATRSKTTPKRDQPTSVSATSRRSAKSGRSANSAPIGVPGMSSKDAQRVIDILQGRLVALLDLQLTLKHIHWNVVGVNFISVHEMLDPQVESVRRMSDTIAERIATLGGEPNGTAAAITGTRTLSDYSLGRAPTVRHLAALDEVYSGVIGDHRNTEAELDELDPVTHDTIVGQLADLEQYQWFVRAHLQDASGDVVFRNAG